jgi:hypothetical protein
MKRIITILLCFANALSMAQTTTVEAESGTLTGTTVLTTRAGFTGTGYVSGFDADGDKVSVTINVASAGNYTLKIKYAIESGYGAKTNDVYVNGVKFMEQIFPESNAFAEIEIGQVALASGNNTIEVRKNWGYFDVDNISVTSGGATGNSAPKAVAGYDQVLMDNNLDGEEQVTISGAGSSDTDGTITTYQWRALDGTILENNNITLTKTLTTGAYEFILKVTDDIGASAEDHVKVFVGDPTNNGKNRLPLRNGTENVFASGVNLAWKNFGNDLDSFDETYFAGVFDDIKEAGGNSMRWWLHTNGKNSPTFSADGKVTGIEIKEIIAMRKALDMAYERGIVISMCLWSFDMLQNQGQNQSQMKQLIENKTYTQTYIDKALIPILQEIGNHPAVMTWEIFNEAEGMTTEFGWADMRTQMKYIQQFVNLVAGAIHRNAPGALVSNSGWSFTAETDKGGNLNYYRDDRLIAAGGDALGTLDFYQVHYYPGYYGNDYSPFHRPASYWGLDKPIVIGEFPMNGIGGKAEPNLTTTECYQRAIAYGYAGVMAWSITDANFGGFSNAIEGMAYLKTNYPEALALTIDPDLNTAPNQIAPLPDINIVMGSTVVVENAVDLKTIFSDEQDGNDLTFSIADNGNQLLAMLELVNGSIVKIVLVENAKGHSEIIFRAQDSDGYSTWATLKLNVQPSNGNLALFKSITSSSNEKTETSEKFANDGDKTTRWSSLYANDQFIDVDLGETKSLNHIKLFWEAAYGKTYDIQVSDDAESWVTVFTESNGNGGEDDIKIESVDARYVRMHGKTRATTYGFSLWEFEVYDDVTTSAGEGPGILIYVYPNPARTAITISVPAAEVNKQIVIYNTVGKTLLHQTLKSTDTIIDISNLPRGFYMISIQQGNRKLLKKIMIE